jgi:hypothetical protein
MYTPLALYQRTEGLASQIRSRNRRGRLMARPGLRERVTCHANRVTNNLRTCRRQGLVII